MARVLRPENLQRRLALCQRRHKIGLGRLQVSRELAGAQRRTFAQARIHNDAVDGTQVSLKGPKYVKYLVVVVHIEGAHKDFDSGICGF